ncbi:hypothetical protein CEE37_06040 [candidate division LCP-89 bacterium B3_LCP]|uniref:Right handed beta helix domain-containing protein n=1 Tax=candidate division LCP-89 bacterium B3_LCP TaxID=2012998 RepID=A0A532V215_UNCL8|nr:MAG: hypothetical protein CEE37_06040 [candidate division LCP-89 bacterium B3_LCP]
MFQIKSLITAYALLVVLAVTTSFAQPIISGQQSGTLGPETYIVNGDIQVLSGQTLTIMPGTVFLHNGNHTWEISGQLNAEGTETDSIKFVRQDPIDEHRWGGIRFLSGSSDQSSIDYCVIDHCFHDIFPFGNYGAGIFIDGIYLEISNSRISNCLNNWEGAGIYAYNATVITSHCLIVDNSTEGESNGGGIYLFNCPQGVIEYSVIARNAATGT